MRGHEWEQCSPHLLKKAMALLKQYDVRPPAMSHEILHLLPPLPKGMITKSSGIQRSMLSSIALFGVAAERGLLKAPRDSCCWVLVVPVRLLDGSLVAISYLSNNRPMTVLATLRQDQTLRGQYICVFVNLL